MANPGIKLVLCAPLLMGALGFGLALHAPGIDTPKVTASVQLPPPPDKDHPDTGHIGDFSTGPVAVPIIVDDATKKKLDELAETYQQVATDNYPLIVKTLKLEGKPAPTKNVRILVTYRYRGVAATSGTGSRQGPRIEVSAKYALAHPLDVGMIVHEMVHVVQSYPTYQPSWLVEGIADYVRWFYYEPVGKRPKPRLPRADARGSYQTTAAFLFWAANKYNSDLVPKLNAAFQANDYKEDLFKTLTGKSLDDLDAEWKATLPGSPQ